MSGRGRRSQPRPMRFADVPAGVGRVLGALVGVFGFVLLFTGALWWVGVR